MGKAIKVLLTKSRQDAHDRGVRSIAMAFRDAGMETILTRYATPDEIVAVALEEDVDVIGISTFTLGFYDATRVAELMKEKNMDDVLFIIGGIIPDDDIPGLLALGVARVFGPGVPPEEAAAFVQEKKGQG